MSEPTADINPPNVLEVKNLTVTYPVRSAILRRKIRETRAVDSVSFGIPKGQTLGLVGESGSGKSTIARAIIGLVPSAGGEVYFRGNDITNIEKSGTRTLRRSIQMIFQDPYASLNPRLTVLDIIAEGWRVHPGIVPRSQWREEAGSLLEKVGLSRDVVDRYPHQFSGGQRQRVGIARALALRPELIICDEAVSALDVSVQAQVLNLLSELQDELQLTYLFIAHDLSVIRHISDQVVVLNEGVVVEEGNVEKIFEDPRDPYTQALLHSIPQVRPWRMKEGA